MNKLEIPKTKKIVLSAMLLAIVLILSRFLSIKTNLLVISLSFIPIMLSAIYLGPKYATLIATLRRFNRCNSVPLWSIFSRIYNNCRINADLFMEYFYIKI